MHLGISGRIGSEDNRNRKRVKRSDGTPSEAEVVGVSSTETTLPVASSVASPDDATDDIAVAPTRTRDDSTDAAAQTTSASPDDAATNASQPPKKKKKKKARVTQYIACHHFDPAILEAMLEQDLATIDLIPAELIEHLGLVDNGMDLLVLKMHSKSIPTRSLTRSKRRTSTKARGTCLRQVTSMPGEIMSRPLLVIGSMN